MIELIVTALGIMGVVIGFAMIFDGYLMGI